MENTNNIFEFPSDPFRMGDEIFLWGVKASDDRTSCIASFHTMNDIDLTYNEKTKQYSLGIETIYYFDSSHDKCEYLIRLLDHFTTWMVSHNYNTNEELSIADVFHWQYNQFQTVSKAYAWFKFMVKAYVEKYK